MTARPLHFYFDFLSPFAYFAWLRVEAFCLEHGLALRPHPIVLAKVLDHWGQRGPAEIPPKREWVFRHCCRHAALHGIPFTLPKFHPFHPLPALRLSLAEVGGEDQLRIIDAIFRAGWAAAADIGDPQVLEAELDRAGLPGARLLEQVSQPAVKAALARETQEAVERGVFGVPTMYIDGELFWGDDQFEHLARFVTGQDPLAAVDVAALLARPASAQRK